VGNDPLQNYVSPSEQDREIEILQEIQQAVLEHADSISAICEKAAVLDWWVKKMPVLV
jgi:hypothetical protein